ncbi:head-tail joining protein [Gluconobacter kondonii]
MLGPCQDVFGEAVEWQSGKIGVWQPISGIFDDAYRPVDLIGGDDGLSPVHITTTRPILGVRESSFQVPPDQGDLIRVRGKVYRIQEVRTDSHGGLHLELNDATGESDALSCDYP